MKRWRLSTRHVRGMEKHMPMTLRVYPLRNTMSSTRRRAKSREQPWHPIKLSMGIVSEIAALSLVPLLNYVQRAMRFLLAASLWMGFDGTLKDSEAGGRWGGAKRDSSLYHGIGRVSGHEQTNQQHATGSVMYAQYQFE